MEQLLHLDQQLIAQINIPIESRPHLHSKRQGTLIQGPVNILYNDKQKSIPHHRQYTQDYHNNFSWVSWLI